MKKKINPMSSEEFYSTFSMHAKGPEKNYYAYFASTIEKIRDFAIAPYFWFIVDNIKMQIISVSNNIDSLSPFSKEDWFSSTDYYIELFHPDDRYYILSAAAFVAKMNLQMNLKNQNEVKFNIYGRIQDRQKKHQWALLQSPKQYINEHNQMESSLVVFYDLSHFKIQNKPLLSMIDFRNKEVQYFKHINQDIKKIDEKVPKITKREREILLLISQGFDTPKIAEKLRISPYTVHNHKRNLREKTKTKTSSQLIAYAMTHSLLFI